MDFAMLIFIPNLFMELKPKLVGRLVKSYTKSVLIIYIVKNYRKMQFIFEFPEVDKLDLK